MAENVRSLHYLTFLSVGWTCFEQGYYYAGIAWSSECFCGNELLYNTITPYQSDCGACSADSSQTCGAVERISVYCNPAILLCESVSTLPSPDPSIPTYAGAPSSLTGFISRCTADNLYVECLGIDEEQTISEDAIIEGCIYVGCPNIIVDAMVTFKHVKFIDSSNTFGSFHRGGALYVKNDVTLENTTFSGCFAARNGGTADGV